MVSLTTMPEDRFPAYRKHLTRGYAQEKVKAGVWSQEEAPGRAEADINGLLPAGTSTEDHFLYTVRDDSAAEKVGTLWLAMMRTSVGRAVWIYDIEIFDRFRRRGYGRRALKAAEDEARRLGADRIELHVFGHNAAARALYESAGYATTSVVMKKGLERRGED